jgi:hypothetical protein
VRPRPRAPAGTGWRCAGTPRDRARPGGEPRWPARFRPTSSTGPRFCRAASRSIRGGPPPGRGRRAGGPAGGLEGGGQAEGQARRGRTVPDGQCEPQARQADHGKVVTADRQRQRHQRRRGHQHHRPGRPAAAQQHHGGGRQDQEQPAEQHPRVQSGERPGHAQQRHHRQVGVVRLVAAGGGEFGGAQVGGAVVEEMRAGAVDDVHLRLRVAGRDQDGERKQDRRGEHAAGDGLRVPAAPWGEGQQRTGSVDGQRDRPPGTVRREPRDRGGRPGEGGVARVEGWSVFVHAPRQPARTAKIIAPGRRPGVGTALPHPSTCPEKPQVRGLHGGSPRLSGRRRAGGSR